MFCFLAEEELVRHEAGCGYTNQRSPPSSALKNYFLYITLDGRKNRDRAAPCLSLIARVFLGVRQDPGDLFILQRADFRM